MGVRDSTGALETLYAANTPDAFWRLLIQPPVSSTEWADAVRAASAILPFAAQDDIDAGGMVATALSEALFGPDRWSLSYESASTIRSSRSSRGL